jgi:hypothetical protein
VKFCVIDRQTSNTAQSPIRVIEQSTGREVGWINRYLDREYVRRLGERTLRIYAYNLLHFVRWWDSIHHTDALRAQDLTESTLLEYLRFQSNKQPRPVGSTINARIAVADRALRNEFPDVPSQVAQAFMTVTYTANRWVWKDSARHESPTRQDRQTQYHALVCR